MSRKYKISLVALIAVFLAAGANAGMRGQRFNQNVERPQFSEIDVNKDGQITQEEMADFRAVRMEQRAKNGRALRNASIDNFEKLDSNSDGVVTTDEFSAYRAVNMANYNGRGKNRKWN